MDDRERLRATFDRAAELYDRARPTYPAQLIDEVIRSAGLKADDHLLEIGCATGTATKPFAERGFAVTCIELGGELAAVARRNLAPYRRISVIHSSFETWVPPEDRLFDLVFAATAWHWIDPHVRYERAWDVLRPGGHLAFWSATHTFPDGGDPFFRDIQEVYEEIGEGMGADAAYPRPGEVADERDDIEASSLFDVVVVRHFDWETVHDADGYIDLLDTFSGHIAMQPWQRERLHGEIRTRLARRPDGLLRRHWAAVLHVARRRA